MVIGLVNKLITPVITMISLFNVPDFSWEMTSEKVPVVETVSYSQITMLKINNIFMEQAYFGFYRIFSEKCQMITAK